METSNYYWLFGIGMSIFGIIYYVHQFLYEKVDKKVNFQLEKNKIYYIHKEDNLESRIAFTCSKCNIKIKGDVFCMDDYQYCSEECRDEHMDKRYQEYQMKIKEKKSKE